MDRRQRLSALMLNVIVWLILGGGVLKTGPVLKGSEQPNFPINVFVAPVDGVDVPIIVKPLTDGSTWATVIGRVYLSWQSNGVLLELQADSVCVAFSESFQFDKLSSLNIQSMKDFFNAELINGIYLTGNVMMSEGLRSIRSDEMYFDIQNQRALAVNAVMKSYDVKRNIPVYVRAAKLKMVALNVFAAEDIVLTTSEFHAPQMSLQAAEVIITDTTAVDAQAGHISDHSFDVQLKDVRVKAGKQTVLRWPEMRSNLERPDIPLKGAGIGNSSRMGTSLETRWHLSRMLGLRESEGTDGTLLMDYFSKRGLGTGIDLDYVKDDSFGRVQGYLMHDHGEDRLGRHDSLRNLEPPRDERGRFRFQHRQFLSQQWQVSTEVAYLSDRNFLEQFYRSEFYTDKEPETLLHIKRLQDNWGLALTGKARINDFTSQVEEMPTAEFHWTGQSLFNDLFTFYSDSQVSQFRHRWDDSVAPVGPTDYYAYAMTRNELDMPLKLNKSKLVPFTAVTAAYDDGPGFAADVDGTALSSESSVLLAEAGLRLTLNPFWRVDSAVQSRLWDLNQLRHVVEPHLTAVSYFQEDPVAEQRDVLSVGVNQRWQTKRGRGAKQRVVDWLQVHVDCTWVNQASADLNGPSHFLWNNPSVPFANRFSRMMPPTDRRTSNFFGPSRHYSSMDALWRVTDSTALLGDCYYDLDGGIVRQSNFGISHMRWPDLNIYLGSRYLRDVVNGFGQVGTNAFTFAATYQLDPRYTTVLSHQYDLDYGATLRSDVTLLRKYHRLNYGLTLSLDAAMDDTSLVFSLWPQGIGELASGIGRYIGAGN